MVEGTTVRQRGKTPIPINGASRRRDGVQGAEMRNTGSPKRSCPKIQNSAASLPCWSDELPHRFGRFASMPKARLSIFAIVIPGLTFSITISRSSIRSGAMSWCGFVAILPLEPRSCCRYQCQPRQLRTLCAYVVLREEVLKPLLAGAKTNRLHDPPKQMAPLDQQYVLLHAQMQPTFERLGLAA